MDHKLFQLLIMACVVLPWPGFSQRGLEQGGIESYIYVCLSGGQSTAI